jgi:hypothetical protein
MLVVGDVVVVVVVIVIGPAIERRRRIATASTANTYRERGHIRQSDDMNTERR